MNKRFMVSALIVVWVGCFLSGIARAASLFTETFPAPDFSDWATAGTGVSWHWQAEYITASFGSSGPGPPPIREALLVANPPASGGAFAGNYTSAGIAMVGFEIWPVHSLPSTVSVDLIRDSSGVISIVTDRIDTVGAWNNIFVPVDLGHSHLWQSAGPGGTTLASVITNVTSFRIYLETLSGSEVEFRFRNVFLAELPFVDTFSPGLANAVDIQWNAVRSNWTYQVDASIDLTSGVWSNVGSFVATDTTADFVDTDAADHPQRTYRLRLE